MASATKRSETPFFTPLNLCIFQLRLNALCMGRMIAKLDS